MVRAESIAKLGPKSPSLGGGVGGIPEFTPQDLAAAMSAGRVTKAEHAYLYVVYLGDQSMDARIVIVRHLQFKASAWPETKAFLAQWSDGQCKGRIEQCVVTALAETLHDSRCPVCLGAKQLRDNPVCPRCNGTGQFEPTIAQRARWASVSAEEWHHRFVDFYKLVKQQLDWLGSDAWRHFLKGIGDGEETTSGDMSVPYTQRKRVASKNVSVRMTPALQQSIEREATRRGLTRTQIVHEALAAYLNS